jgi:hypothetical protein
MLGQYAQIMAIKAAQQEMQGSEDVRRYFSAPADQRGDISQIMHTKGGRAASETMSQNAQRDLKMQLDALGAAKQNVYMAKDPASLAEYIKGVYSSPAGKLLSTFVPVDKALAAIPADPVAFKEYQKNFGLTADQIVVNATKERGQNMTDARAREQMAFEKQKGKTIAGEGQFFREDVYGNLYPVQGFGAQFGPDAPAPAMPPAAANAFVTTRPPSVNALAPTAPPVVQPGSPTVANAAAIEAQQNIPRPKVPFTTPVPVIDPVTGNTVLMEGKKAVATGATPATAATEARQVAIRKLPDAIAQSRDALNLIDRMVGTSDGKTKPHEGFKGAVGAGMGLRFVPGTSESDFQAMYDQIQGGAFLQAFNTLKGGGQITEKEGEKGTAAINRMKLATSEKEFITAARDFQAVLRRGVETAQKELRSGNKSGATDDPLEIR